MKSVRADRQTASDAVRGQEDKYAQQQQQYSLSTSALSSSCKANAALLFFRNLVTVSSKSTSVLSATDPEQLLSDSRKAVSSNSLAGFRI